MVTAYRLLAPSFVTGVLIAGAGLLILYTPWLVVVACGVAAVGAMLRVAMRPLTLWQQLTFVTLLGYVVLSYGFANWTVPRTPVPVGYVLLLPPLWLLLRRSRADANAFLREPAVRTWLLLVGLTIAHLLIDLPRHGLFAIRDASFVLEGVVMVIGFSWARSEKGARAFLVALVVLFLVNALYALTYPIRDVLEAHSPVSGVFQQVPVFGSYTHTALFLIAGAFYYLLVAEKVVRWPKALLFGLAALQASWSLVFQLRAVYIGTAAALLLSMMLGGVRRGGKATVALLAGMVLFFVLISASGMSMRGRIGQVTPQFLIAHMEGVFLNPNAPEEATAQWRLDLLSEALGEWKSSLATMLVGVGFGRPLTDWGLAGNVIVRQPHDTHLTALVRLGAVGFVLWLCMLWRMFAALRSQLRYSRPDTVHHVFALWSLMFFVVGIAFTTFQPWLEFSNGAIPFYLLVGFAMGLPLGAPVPVPGTAGSRDGRSRGAVRR